MWKKKQGFGNIKIRSRHSINIDGQGKCCRYKNLEGIIELKKRNKCFSGSGNLRKRRTTEKGETYLDSLLETCSWIENVNFFKL